MLIKETTTFQIFNSLILKKFHKQNLISYLVINNFYYIAIKAKIPGCNKYLATIKIKINFIVVFSFHRPWLY